MKRIILISMLFLSMTACIIMPSKKTAEYKDISFYYIPNVNIGIGVYSNDTQQTVRVFHKSEPFFSAQRRTDEETGCNNTLLPSGRKERFRRSPEKTRNALLRCTTWSIRVHPASLP